MLGPSLARVIGRKAGTEAGYSYSEAIKQSGLTWDVPTLEAVLDAPGVQADHVKGLFSGDQSTPLHFAVQHDRPVALICKLVKLGVDVSAKRDDGQTAADLARAKGNTNSLNPLGTLGVVCST